MRFILAILIFCLVSFSPAQAHEVRPAYLKIDETAANAFSVLWKQPVLEGKRLRIVPVFPEMCSRSEPVQSLKAATINEEFRVNCSLKEGQIVLDGLERTLTDVFVEINYLDASTRTALLKPSDPTLSLSGPVASSTGNYLSMGIDHILRGWDHLLFVIGLTLLVSRRQILGVATSFTVAHSITLAMAAFGFLSVPSRAVEILIAASIVMLAIEILHKKNGRETLASRRPYLIGFAIGLIHGCGFATALAEIGLPKGTELLALLLFNLGVELGQFGVIAIAVLALAGVAKIGTRYLRASETFATYFIGTVAMFWVIDRGKDYIL